jgi:hypothetical protein
LRYALVTRSHKYHVLTIEKVKMLFPHNVPQKEHERYWDLSLEYTFFKLNIELSVKLNNWSKFHVKYKKEANFVSRLRDGIRKKKIELKKT